MNVFRKRKQLRLKGYNYSQNGYYFVTICSESRGNIFGKIIEGTMEANSLGKSVAECLSQIPKHFPFVIVDEYVVMPNNVHAIIQINNINVGANNYSPLPKGKRPNGTSMTLGSIIRGFKKGVVKIARNKNFIHKLWQRNYYEHIIRSDDELQEIRKYIADNPKNWKKDKLYY